jgi:hypothetical protein
MAALLCATACYCIYVLIPLLHLCCTSVATMYYCMLLYMCPHTSSARERTSAAAPHCGSRTAAEVKQRCNRGATRTAGRALQQRCNRGATEVQQRCNPHCGSRTATSAVRCGSGRRLSGRSAGRYFLCASVSAQHSRCTLAQLATLN